MNELETLTRSLQGLIEMDDEVFDDERMKALLDTLDQQFSPEVVNQSINQIVKNLEDQGLDKKDAEKAIKLLEDTLVEAIYGQGVIIGNKKVFIDSIMERTKNIFSKALEKFHSYAIELPMTLDEGAQAPSYAHDSDAAADMYATEDIEIPAHFRGVPVGTGVHIQLPEGWVAMLFPRSSIGAKTPLRLSNSVGIIDSGYRGEIRALYDNTGDEPYQIHKGDRIAQLMVMPSYRFKAQVVDTLEDSDRGEGGFGSTGT